MNRFLGAESFEYSELSIDADQAGVFVGEPDQSKVTYHSGLSLGWNGKQPAAIGNARSRSFDFAAKRAMDIVVSLLALIALMPLLLIVAAIVKLTSRGPVLFRQAREGLNGSLFDVYKFRSMTVEASDLSGINQTIRDDPRVTRIGKFIRRTSIDELPQLLNVLRGDMSLVGPRPHVPGMLAGGVKYKTLVPYYNHRFAMRPGITGWAQANGLRGPTTEVGAARARVDHDIAYIQNFSIWLDLKTMMLTVRNEFVTGSGH